MSEELLENFNDTKEQLRFNQNMMNDYSMTRKEKLIHEQEHSDEKHSSIDKSRPHLSNISQDMQLSRLINYSIDTDLTTIGKRHVVPPNDIELVGMGIRETHAHILKEDGHYMIEAITQDEDANCYLNGDLVETKVELHHLDRLSFGTNYMFLVLIPGTDSRD